MTARRRVVAFVCVLLAVGLFLTGYGVAALLTDEQTLSGTFSTNESAEEPVTIVDESNSTAEEMNSSTDSSNSTTEETNSSNSTTE